MLIFLLIGSLLLQIYLSVRLPFGVHCSGSPLESISLTLRERLLLRRRNLYVLGLISLLAAIGHWFPTTVELGLLLFGLCITLLPTSYRLTTAGVACNNTVFRRWDEFRSVQIKGAYLIFKPQSGFGPLKLALLPTRQQKMLPILKRYLTVVSAESTHRIKQNKLPSSGIRVLNRNMFKLFAVCASLLMIVVLVSACGEIGADPSGNSTANQKNLTHVVVSGTSPTISSNDLSQAKKQEPFAYNLALFVDENRLGINFVWTLVTGYLVMFMQLGFALLEVGLCRAKNAAHTMGMNIMIYAISMLGFFAAGFAFQFGGVGIVGVPNLGGLAGLNRELSIHIGNVDWGLLGFKGFFFNDSSYDVGIAVMFLFQMVFMDTAATIPTGAMAERWKWSSFCVYGLFFSTLIYPVFGNWAWGGGWLSQLSNIGLGAGYVDFAGSGVVHAVGGWCALAGAMVLGPRIGKYNRDGSANTIPGHNTILAIVGCLILAFGWFGFNPGSTLGAAGNGNLRIGLIAVNTMLASAAGAVVAMMYMSITGAKKPDLAMIGNGLLAGLVAITAPSGYVSPLGSCAIGAIAGFNVVFFSGIIEKVWKIDDPVGAIAVHGVNGMWGQLSVGLFADGLANYGGLQVRGLFYGDAGQLVAQAIGALTCFIYVFGMSFLFFKLYDLLFGLRVSAEVELAGLDIPEMGALAYPLENDANSGHLPPGSSVPLMPWPQPSGNSFTQQPQQPSFPPQNPLGPQQKPMGVSNPISQMPINQAYPGMPAQPYNAGPLGNQANPDQNAQSGASWQSRRNMPHRVNLDGEGMPRTR